MLVEIETRYSRLKRYCNYENMMMCPLSAKIFEQVYRRNCNLILCMHEPTKEIP